MPFVCSLLFEDSEQQYCDECRPYLYLHGIRRCADKTLDMEVLLEVAKEDFNVPPCLIEVGDCSRREFHVVGEQHHREMVLSVIYGNPAYIFGVLSGRAVSCQPHDFVYEYFLMGVIGQVTFLYALINQIVLHPDDEEYLYAVPKIHQERIEVTAVADGNASRLHLYVPGCGIISRLPVCNMHKLREHRMEVQ